MADNMVKKAELEIEKLYIKKCGFSPAILDDLADSLKHCHDVISFHSGTTMSLSEETKNRLTELSFKTDKLSLDLDELYLSSSMIIEEVKKKYYFNKEMDLNEEFINDFREKVKKAKENLREVISQIKDYVDFAQKSKY